MCVCVILQCSDCPKAFTTSSQLTEHIRRAHTGEKLYACDVCEYSCASSSNLTVHKRIHTGEKPHKVMHGSYMCATSHKHMHCARVYFDVCFTM